MNIEQLLRQGLSYTEIQQVTGLSKATISYHAKKHGLQKIEHAEYDWKAIQKDIDQGLHTQNIKDKYGISWNVIDTAVRNGMITSPKKKNKHTKQNCFTIQSKTNRATLKKIILKEGLLPNRCAICEMEPKWNNSDLVFVLDHINGVNNDNRLENLRLLCPNCNSQTETFSGRNLKRKRLAGQPIITPP